MEMVSFGLCSQQARESFGARLSRIVKGHAFVVVGLVTYRAVCWPIQFDFEHLDQAVRV